MRDKVERVLEIIRPVLQADGGNVELLDVKDEGVVLVWLVGTCAGCHGPQMTLQMGIEEALRRHVPEVTRVEAVM